MSATAVTPQPQQQQQQQSELAANTRGGYRSLLSKPTRLWQRNKTAPLVDPSSTDGPNKLVFAAVAATNKKSKLKFSLALRETAADSIFKMSTINDSGAYLPPSPCEDTKRDHWLEIDQDKLIFCLPNTDCLTKNHCFYTPSATI